MSADHQRNGVQRDGKNNCTAPVLQHQTVQRCACQNARRNSRKSTRFQAGVLKGLREREGRDLPDGLCDQPSHDDLFRRARRTLRRVRLVVVNNNSDAGFALSQQFVDLVSKVAIPKQLARAVAENVHSPKPTLLRRTLVVDCDRTGHESGLSGHPLTQRTETAICFSPWG